MDIKGWRSPYVCRQLNRHDRFLSEVKRGTAHFRERDYTILSALFGVSVEYLKCETDDPKDGTLYEETASGVYNILKKEEPIPVVGDELTKEFMSMLPKLTLEQRMSLMVLMKGLLGPNQ